MQRFEYKKERIRLEDVVPNERNVRTRFEGIDELAESISVTGGEPIVSIIVLRDGGLYRLVDGERRYRAMRKLGTKTCTALVCEDWDEADAAMAAMAMVATDDKQPLTDLEKSRGMQLMLTGLPIEDVAKVAKVSKAKVKAVRDAVAIVGDAAEDMTTDRLEWIAGHPGITADELPAVENAAEKDWRHVADAIEEDHRVADAVAAKVAELEAAGVTVVAQEPERADGWFYVAESNACDECVAYVKPARYSKDGCYVWRYCRDGEAHGHKGETPEEAAARAEEERRRDERRAADKADSERRKELFCGVCNQEEMDILLETFGKWFVPWCKANFWMMHDIEVAEQNEWKLPMLAFQWMEWRLENPGDMTKEERADLYLDWVVTVHESSVDYEFSPNEEQRLDEAREVMHRVWRGEMPDPDPEDIEEVGF